MSEPMMQIHETQVPRWIAAGLAAATLVLAGCTVAKQSSEATSEHSKAGLQILQEFDETHGQDLLKGTWQYMPGASLSAGSLMIRHTGEAILTNPNTGHATVSPVYVPDPPVNVYGTRLSVTQGNDVGFAVHISNMHGPATVSFHAKPPIRYDERIEREAGIDVTVDGSRATLTVYGDPAQPDNKPKTATFSLKKSSADADITIAQEGSTVIAVIDGQRTNLSAKPFNGQVWFGMDAPRKGGSFKVSGLTVYPVHGSSVAPVDMSHYYDNAKASPDGLAALAKRHDQARLDGTTVDLNTLMADPQYTEFVLQNFNEIETETLGKFQTLQPEEGQYNFAELDALVDFASKHNLMIHGHALIFGEAYPQWLHDKLAASSPDQARKLMKDHITTVMSRYDGKHGHGQIKYWDVVNEPFDQDNLGQLNKDNIWYKAIGETYIQDALTYALSANPDGIVAINENSMEGDNDQWPGMQSLMQQLKSARLDIRRIQIGFQCHYDEETLADQDDMNVLYGGELAARFKWVKNMGFYGARVSEASVALSNGDGYPDDPATQAKVYGLLFALSNDFNMWGATSSPYYFTTARDNDGTLSIGDDAPTFQDSTGIIMPRLAFTSLKKTAAPR